MKYSIVIPVYKNEASIEALMHKLCELNHSLQQSLEVVFVVDGSPDNSFAMLKKALPHIPFEVQLLAHSRNFGSFAAIRTGLMAARGDFFGVMAADLQEPPELLVDFFRLLSRDECDVAVGSRSSRQDPLLTRWASALFWGLYRKLIVPEMPKGGVDVFACNRAFREPLLQLEEARSSLIALIFWLGFRRKIVYYDRQARQGGRSAWTLKKKVDYMLDSIFAFTDVPIRLLMILGGGGLCFSLLGGAIILLSKISGIIPVPGYAATMLAILAFGAFNSLGLGLVGTYAWRAYENTKRRPLSIVSCKIEAQKPL